MLQTLQSCSHATPSLSQLLFVRHLHALPGAIHIGEAPIIELASFWLDLAPSPHLMVKPMATTIVGAHPIVFSICSI